MRYLISQEDANKILEYLIKCPYGEVSKLVNILLDLQQEIINAPTTTITPPAPGKKKDIINAEGKKIGYVKTPPKKV